MLGVQILFISSDLFLELAAEKKFFVTGSSKVAVIAHGDVLPPAQRYPHSAKQGM